MTKRLFKEKEIDKKCYFVTLPISAITENVKRKIKKINDSSNYSTVIIWMSAWVEGALICGGCLFKPGC